MPHLMNGHLITPRASTQLAFTLPSSPDARVHVQLTNTTFSLTLFLASSSLLSPTPSASLGTLVYALPNVGTSISIGRRSGVVDYLLENDPS